MSPTVTGFDGSNPPRAIGSPGTWTISNSHRVRDPLGLKTTLTRSRRSAIRSATSGLNVNSLPCGWPIAVAASTTLRAVLRGEPSGRLAITRSKKSSRASIFNGIGFGATAPLGVPGGASGRDSPSAFISINVRVAADSPSRRVTLSSPLAENAAIPRTTIAATSANRAIPSPFSLVHPPWSIATNSSEGLAKVSTESQPATVS